MEQAIQEMSRHFEITDRTMTSLGENLTMTQALAMVPNFDGQNMPLRSFLQDVERALQLVTEASLVAFQGKASKRWAGLPVIPELLSSFQDIEKEELVEPPTFDTEKSIADTIPNELYYPGISNVSDDLNLSIHTSNENLTYFRDNYLHFIPADCELTTIVSRLLIDTDKIDPQDLKLKKPKLNQILITNNVIPQTNMYVLCSLGLEVMNLINSCSWILWVIPTVMGFIAYDCSTPLINITSLSLVDIKDCKLPIVEPTITKTKVQLLQSIKVTHVQVIQCKLLIYRKISYCGILNHLFGVPNGDVTIE
ncbi:hypothetical protein KQX54_006117 [Cotesia glomerata]|uniref:Uncharacterized protein n=1 Tax=Cotesia glomerata TaxID=32391 RepID=A0AAV7II69_COTGL|nr:hypothetical protein KQX54_006117 [Cotesia glomerata]